MQQCIETECFDYLSLLLKYIDKHKKTIGSGINFKDFGDHPLILLLTSDFIDEINLQIYLDAAIQSEVKIDNEILKESIEICENEPDDQFKQYKLMLEKYESNSKQQ